MKNPNKQANHKQVKTYISVTNQNRISDTLTVEDTRPEIEEAPSSDDIISGDKSANGKVPPQLSSHEPEALSAEAPFLPPTAATPDAEAVAGLPLGSSYDQEGDFEADTLEDASGI